MKKNNNNNYRLQKIDNEFLIIFQKLQYNIMSALQLLNRLMEFLCFFMAAIHVSLSTSKDSQKRLLIFDPAITSHNEKSINQKCRLAN